MIVTDNRVFSVTQLMIRTDGADTDGEGEPAGDPIVLIMGVKDGQISERALFMAAPAEILPPPAE